ncbi:30S ribosomal protein S20 [Bacilli bacterium]|nr:30S ribosomal protein S20 [Bacilli bacterium]
MANIKANIKSIRKTKTRHLRNKSVLTNVKTKTKAVRKNGTDKELAAAYKKIDSACAKGKIHKNKANRMKARLAASVNKKNTKK